MILAVREKDRGAFRRVSDKSMKEVTEWGELCLGNFGGSLRLGIGVSFTRLGSGSAQEEELFKLIERDKESVATFKLPSGTTQRLERRKLLVVGGFLFPKHKQ